MENQMRPKLKTWPLAGLLSVLVVLLVLSACTPVQAYVEADRATYQAIAPDHRMYVQNDPALSGEQKARRFNLLDSWDLRTRKAEGR